MVATFSRPIIRGSDSRDRRVTENLGLVRKVARRWEKLCREPYDDLYQEGVLGLIKAARNFDEGKGFQFSSFAVPLIEGEIRHYLRGRGYGTIRPPRRDLEDWARVVKAQRELAQRGRSLDLATVARLLGFSAERWRCVVEAKGARLAELSEDMPAEAATPDKDWLGAIALLPSFQQAVLRERFFGGLEPEAIALRHGCSVVLVELAIEAGLDGLRRAIG